MLEPAASIPCLCACLRSAARAVSRRYAERMSSAGLGASQFTLLMALSYAGLTRQRDLAELISADSTTLTRTLGLLESEGLLVSQPGEDRRERIWAVTPSGRERLDAAKPLWERAQADLRGRLGPEDWDTLKRLLAKVVQAA